MLVASALNHFILHVKLAYAKISVISQCSDLKKFALSMLRFSLKSIYDLHRRIKLSNVYSLTGIHLDARLDVWLGNINIALKHIRSIFVDNNLLIELKIKHIVITYVCIIVISLKIEKKILSKISNDQSIMPFGIFISIGLTFTFTINIFKFMLPFYWNVPLSIHWNVHPFQNWNRV